MDAHQLASERGEDLGLTSLVKILGLLLRLIKVLVGELVLGLRHTRGPRSELRIFHLPCLVLLLQQPLTVDRTLHGFPSTER